MSEIHIHIDKLVENISITGTPNSEEFERVKGKITETLVSAVAEAKEKDSNSDWIAALYCILCFCCGISVGFNLPGLIKHLYQ